MSSDFTGLPQIVLLAVPVPFILLLLLIALYHLTPLLSLLPNIHLLPLLNRLSTIIPSPKRNLPREFFNLPPRPSSTDGAAASIEDLRVLSVRGKVVLVLTAYAALSLVCGWAFLATGAETWSLGAIASTGVLSAAATLSVFAIHQPSSAGKLIKGGGVTHATVFPRIFPISLIPVILATALSAAGSEVAPKAVLGLTSLLVVTIIGCSLTGLYNTHYAPRAGIRLGSPDAENVDQSGTVEESWLSSFSQPSEAHFSSFAYSATPSFKTPKARNKPRTTTSNGTLTSWLSSPTNTPDTIPSWNSDSITSPQSVLTRQRSHSPIPDSIPGPIQPAPVRRGKGSVATSAGDRTMNTTFTSPGGSILGGYNPSPSRPIPPRGFASLTSFPLSPAQMEAMGNSSGGRVSHPPGDGIVFVPEERSGMSGARESTWTLGTCHSEHAPTTPGHPGAETPAEERRAPPPPPMPVDMPLPPTPTAARSETAVEWGPYAKESREYLMGERDWVEVDPDVDGLEKWSREGRGVGFVAVLGAVAYYAFSVPMLVLGLNSLTQTLYLISLLLPGIFTALASYLLRYRPTRTIRERAKKASLKSQSTRMSLALTAPSDTSLPLSLAERLHLETDTRESEPDAGLSHLLQPKPSVSNFGYNRRFRTSTVYGELSKIDRLAEEKFRKTMSRYSGDVWRDEGHAVETNTRWSRVVEMIKPVPALAVLDTRPPLEGVVKKLRGSVVSMLPKTMGGAISDTPASDATPSSPVINITSPSKFDRRSSAISSFTHEGETEEVEGMTTMQSAEIQVATKARMSSSPIFFCGRPGSAAVVRGEDGYELDWLTAGVLPSLVPNIKIGPDVRVAPGPSELAARRASQPEQTLMNEHEVGDSSIGSVPRFRGSLDMATPSRHGHTRAQSSSVDFTLPNFAGATVSTPHANIRHRIKHKASFSLPIINPADFADVRRSFDECGKVSEQDNGEDDGMGIDLPPVPASYIHRGDLSRVSENEEGNESSLMRQTINEIAPAILALSSSTASATTEASSRMDLADLAPIILHGNNLQASVSSSIRSEEELMAEEMERVMAMDTPTRAEFVISPPPSSYAASIGGGRDSRASVRTARSVSSMDSVPPMPQRTSTGWLTTPADNTRNHDGVDSNEHAGDQTRFVDADEDDHPHYRLAFEQDISIGLSEFRHPLSHAISMPTLSHPHPPPLPPHAGQINFSRPGLPPVLRPHTPIAAQDLRKVRPQNSDETMSTTYTQHTPASVHIEGAHEHFHLDQRERDRIQKLKDRAHAAAPQKGEGARSRSAMGHRERDKLREKQIKDKPKSALKPLQQAEKKDNRMPMPILYADKRVSGLYHDPNGEEERYGLGEAEKGATSESRSNAKGSGSSVAERRGKRGKLSAISTGSGKENQRGGGRGSKVPTGSGRGTGPRGLRA